MCIHRHDIGQRLRIFAAAVLLRGVRRAHISILLTVPVGSADILICITG